ncbi:MAG: Uma2 family endonuclease [Rubrobacteraceae bacterium]
MSEPAAPQEPLSIEEYLELELTSEMRHEYVAGEIHAHAGGTRRHGLISGNIFASLWTIARDGPCQVHTADRLLQASEDVFYYPDVMVVCLPEDEPGNDEALFEDSPCLVVEVTSPSTENIDRREKLLAYRNITSLKAYLIVDQRELRVERHWRDESGRWWRAEAVGTDGIVPIPCPETELTLPQIYEGL